MTVPATESATNVSSSRVQQSLCVSKCVQEFTSIKNIKLKCINYTTECYIWLSLLQSPHIRQRQTCFYSFDNVPTEVTQSGSVYETTANHCGCHNIKGEQQTKSSFECCQHSKLLHSAFIVAICAWFIYTYIFYLVIFSCNSWQQFSQDPKADTEAGQVKLH